MPEEDEVLHAEDLRGVPRLALADGHQARIVGRVRVGAGAAGRDQAEDDVTPFARPAGRAPGDRELVVVGVRRDAEDPRELRVERVRSARAVRHRAGARPATRAWSASTAPAAARAP